MADKNDELWSTEPKALEAMTLATDYLFKHNYADDTDISVKAVILYGSRVYDTHTDDSDHDYLVVVDSTTLSHPIEVEIGIHHLENSDVEVSVMSDTLFDSLLENCEVRTIESIFTSKSFVPIGYSWIQERKDIFSDRFESDPDTTKNLLRSAFSAVSSNSEVKGRKKVRDAKLTSGELSYSECMIGLKSVFHSIRLLMFGVQIGESKKIEDFTSAKECWDEIMTELVPKIGTGELTPSDIKKFYKKWAKTPEEGETKHLLTKFKDSLPKL